MKAKWLTGILAGVLSLSVIQPVAAEDDKTIEDEIIYDVLVDRFFNKKIDNDFEVDAQNPAMYSGGDFDGAVEQLLHVQEMGFTLLSVGPVFASDTYDGKQVLDYSQLERHFGTEDELKNMIAKAQELDLKLMIDVPTQSISANHLWVAENPQWFTKNENGTVALDTSNPDVQEALISTFKKFIGKFKVDALRLQDAGQLDPGFIGTFSEEMKSVRDLYILSDQEMEPAAGFDAVVVPEVEEALRASFKNFDQDTSALPALMEKSAGNLTRIDSLNGSRFTKDVLEESGFPPTRWRLVLSQLLLMPGIPVVQYGSETAMSGDALPESHQILDLAVDEELIDHVTNLNSLRNDSAALRTGDIEVLAEEDGWIVFKRSNDEESWIIAINNTSSTKSINLSAEVIGGDGKEMRGLFESDVVRQKSDGEYKITLDRELVEAFNITEERGLNSAYFIALAILYLGFLTFLWFVWRKGKQRKADAAAKRNA